MMITQRFNRPAYAVPATALAVLVSSCSSASSTPPPAQNRLSGASAPLGAGTASTFVTTDGLGRACAMGLTFNDAALTNLGDDMSMTVLLPLPNAHKRWWLNTAVRFFCDITAQHTTQRPSSR